MKTILIYLIATVFITSSCNGCNFIKDRFVIKKQVPQETGQTEEQVPAQERESEPIPVNPLHS